MVHWPIFVYLVELASRNELTTSHFDTKHLLKIYNSMSLIVNYLLIKWIYNDVFTFHLEFELDQQDILKNIPSMTPLCCFMPNFWLFLK
jgi:hypothetical protein